MEDAALVLEEATLGVSEAFLALACFVLLVVGLAAGFLGSVVVVFFCRLDPPPVASPSAGLFFVFFLGAMIIVRLARKEEIGLKG